MPENYYLRMMGGISREPPIKKQRLESAEADDQCPTVRMVRIMILAMSKMLEIKVIRVSDACS